MHSGSSQPLSFVPRTLETGNGAFSESRTARRITNERDENVERKQFVPVTRPVGESVERNAPCVCACASRGCCFPAPLLSSRAVQVRLRLAGSPWLVCGSAVTHSRRAAAAEIFEAAVDSQKPAR